MLCWTAPMTGGNRWEVPPPAVLSFNSPRNPLVPIQDHRCYIQPVVEVEESEPTEEGEGCMMAPPSPLFVYADFEAMQYAEGVFVANLLCYSSSEETTVHVLDGEDCAHNFYVI